MKRVLFLSFILLLMFMYLNVDVVYHYLMSDVNEVLVSVPAYDELIIRIPITLLVLCLTFSLDYYMQQYSLVRSRSKKAIYKSMLSASQHIVNNLLNQMTLYQHEAERCESFNKEVLIMYVNSLNEAENLMIKLSNISDINEHAIWDSVKP